MVKKELKTFSLSDEAFDKVLTEYAEYVVQVKDISKYLYGSASKASIFYNGSNKMVLTQRSLSIIGYDINNSWMQCICIRKSKQTTNFRPAINGGIAWKKMTAILHKYYNDKELDYCLRQFQAKYAKDKNQLHINYLPNNEAKVIHNFSNCFKYDINGAYAKALCEIFPKAEKAIVKLYLERKEKSENKELINYFVGMLCVKNYRETFNWIVQNVRKQMEKTINDVNGILLYANTDGFAVYAPEKTVLTSSALGDFKLEYKGDIQIYAGSNYWIIQAGNEIIGNALHSVRKHIDLRLGKVVEYTRKKIGSVYVVDEIKQQVNVERKYYGC